MTFCDARKPDRRSLAHGARALPVSSWAMVMLWIAQVQGMGLTLELLFTGKVIELLAFSLLGLNHSARDTFFAGKATCLSLIHISEPTRPY